MKLKTLALLIFLNSSLCNAIENDTPAYLNAGNSLNQMRRGDFQYRNLITLESMRARQFNQDLSKNSFFYVETNESSIPALRKFGVYPELKQRLVNLSSAYDQLNRFTVRHDFKSIAMVFSAQDGVTGLHSNGDVAKYLGKIDQLFQDIQHARNAGELENRIARMETELAPSLARVYAHKTGALILNTNSRTGKVTSVKVKSILSAKTGRGLIGIIAAGLASQTIAKENSSVHSSEVQSGELYDFQSRRWVNQSSVR